MTHLIRPEPSVSVGVDGTAALCGERSHRASQAEALDSPRDVDAANLLDSATKEALRKTVCGLRQPLIEASRVASMASCSSWADARGWSFP
jgi:hypothetical protein